MTPLHQIARMVVSVFVLLVIYHLPRWDKETMLSKTQSVFARFIKAMLSGAAAAVGLVTFETPKVWTDFPTILNMLGVAFVFGALTGLIMAFHKWANWKE